MTERRTDSAQPSARPNVRPNVRDAALDAVGLEALVAAVGAIPVAVAAPAPTRRPHVFAFSIALAGTLALLIAWEGLRDG